MQIPIAEVAYRMSVTEQRRCGCVMRLVALRKCYMPLQLLFAEVCDYKH